MPLQAASRVTSSPVGWAEPHRMAQVLHLTVQDRVWDVAKLWDLPGVKSPWMPCSDVAGALRMP